MAFKTCGGVGRNGDAIASSGILSITYCLFENCSADCGGAVRTLGTDVVILDSAFIRCKASGDSGAVECLRGITRIDRCSFWGNSANSGGSGRGGT